MGTIPPGLILLNIKETKITMYTVSKPALLQISQCPHFPRLLWAITSSLHLSLSYTHMLYWARQNSVFIRALGKERTVSCLRCRFIIRHQLSSLEAQCYWTALHVMDSICQEDYICIYTTRLNAQIWSFDHFRFCVPPVQLRNDYLWPLSATRLTLVFWMSLLFNW